MAVLSVRQTTIPETVTRFRVLYRYPDGNIAASDCEYVDWNQAALDLLGVKTLRNHCKSEYRPWQETENSRLKLAAARLPKHRRCNERVTQCFDRPLDGERLWLHEEVQTFGIGEDTHWRSLLRVSSQPGTLEAISPTLYGLSREDIRLVAGDHYVASLQPLPKHLTSVLALANIIPAGLNICKVLGQSSVFIGSLGAFRRRYLHCCQWCGLLWASFLVKPRTCARRGGPGDAGCGTKAWWHG